MFYLELFRALQEDDVRYVVVGGLAVNLHGVSRLTMDVDLIIALDGENLARFPNAAQRLGLKPVVPVTLADLGDEAKVRSWIVEKHMLAFALRPPGRADPTIGLLTQPSVAFADAYARRVEKDLGGIRVPIAGLDRDRPAQGRVGHRCPAHAEGGARQRGTAMTHERAERDYYYDLPLEEIRRGLSLTPLERLQRLDELRRFVLMARQAPTVRPQAAEPPPAPYPPELPD